jgi:hypothetical protein
MEGTTTNTLFNTERLSQRQRESKDFQWYKDKARAFIAESRNYVGYGGVSEHHRMKVNYDLYNNIVNLEDFAYVTTPYGSEEGELPAQMANRDISSYRIKALLGMEMKRPFGYRLVATNREASNRKMDENANRIRQYVVDAIMLPIKQEVEAKYMAEAKGRQLTAEEREGLQAQMAEEVAAKTPEKVKQYMQRDHRDPAEVQGQQILNHVIKRQDVRAKFNQGWKHAMLSAYEVYWIGIIKDEPILKVINPLRFNCDRSPESGFIEDGAWAVCEYRMHPAEVLNSFELTDKEIDQIWKLHASATYATNYANAFEFGPNIDSSDEQNTVPVFHVVFKTPKKIGWLDYIDEEGQLQTDMLVDETYKLDPEIGDVAVSWEWISEVHETWVIGEDIHKNMGAVEGQLRDQDTLYNAKLPYIGAIYDATNSGPTCPMDRMKVYQYYHNIVMYRLELLLASDKGKKILMNINAIPESAGMSIEKWQYFFESTPFMWYNPDEEGMNQNDVNTIAKTLDLSLVSDINRYIELANYLEQKCGKSVGVTDPVLGQTSVSERVANNQQNLVQTSYMLEPYFDLHNLVKRNVLQRFVDLARIAYARGKKEYITNVLDDMSLEMLKVDVNLLEETTFALYVEDSSMSEEIRETIKTLTHAAMQTQKAELSDVLKVLRKDTLQEAEEALVLAEQTRNEKNQQQAMAMEKAKGEENEKARNFEREKWAHEINKIRVEAEEDRETQIQKQTILSMGFDPNKDQDNDRIPDVLEVAKYGVDAEIKRGKLALESRELDHKIQDDKEKNMLKDKELNTKAKPPKK